MSKNAKKVSAKERGEQKNDSVYDFIYYDRQRVGSFLAQFNASGHLQQIKESESASKGGKHGVKISAGASYLGTGANLGFEHAPGEHGAEATERVYDPLWTNALVFLDYLEERGLLQRNVPAARIGQFILATGALSVADLPLLRKIWETPAMKAAMIGQFQATVAHLVAQQAAAQQAAAAQQGVQPVAAPPVAPAPVPAPVPPQPPLSLPPRWKYWLFCRSFYRQLLKVKITPFGAD